MSALVACLEGLDGQVQIVVVGEDKSQVFGCCLALLLCYSGGHRAKL